MMFSKVNIAFVFRSIANIFVSFALLFGYMAWDYALGLQYWGSCELSLNLSTTRSKRFEVDLLLIINCHG